MGDRMTRNSFKWYDALIVVSMLGIIAAAAIYDDSLSGHVLPAPGSTLTIPKPPEHKVTEHITDEIQDPVVEVDMYVRGFLKDVPEYRYKVAREFIPFVVAYSEQYGIDPLLLAVLISVESSWTPSALGSLNEKGLCQVHGVAARGYDLSIAEQQIEAGAAWLSKCIDWCGGDVLGGLSLYQSGRGCSPHKGSKRRIEMYNEAHKEIRGY